MEAADTFAAVHSSAEADSSSVAVDSSAEAASAEAAAVLLRILCRMPIRAELMLRRQRNG